MAGRLNNLVGAVAGRTVVVVQNLTVGRDFHAGAESIVDDALQRTTRLERDVSIGVGLLITCGPLVVLLLPPDWFIRIGIGLAVAAIGNAVVAAYLSILTRKLAHQKLLLSGALAENAAAAAAANWFSHRGGSGPGLHSSGGVAQVAVRPVALCICTTALVASALFVTQQPVPPPEVYADEAPPPPAPTPAARGWWSRRFRRSLHRRPHRRRQLARVIVVRPHPTTIPPAPQPKLPDVISVAHGPPPSDAGPSVDCESKYGTHVTTRVENGIRIRQGWTAVTGRLPPETIQRTIRSHLPVVRGCTVPMIHAARIEFDLMVRADSGVDVAK